MRRIQNLTVSDFRSIRGTVSVPLDANIVLIHGPNGAGKTSLLSALELALTGTVESLREMSADYLHHVVHDGAANAVIELHADDDGTPKSNLIQISSGGISGQPLLDQLDARYFAERAYLPQSRLSRLLEMYEEADKRGGSLLTTFVNDLLGLDRIDAIIDGLEKAGDIRQTKKLVPEFARTEREEQQLATELATMQRTLESETKQEEQFKSDIVSIMSGLAPEIDNLFTSPKRLETVLHKIDNDLATQYDELSRHRLEINALTLNLSSRSSIGSNELDQAALRKRKADLDWEDWSKSNSTQISNISAQALSLFQIPDLAVSGNPSELLQNLSELHEARSVELEKELETHALQLSTIKTLETSLAPVEKELADTHGAIAAINESSNLNEISGLLVELSHHISSDVCPVCGRDYSEISTQSLAHRLQTVTASTTEQSQTLEELLGRRRDLLTTKKRLTEELADSRVTLDDDARASLRDREYENLKQFKLQLGKLGPAATIGGALFAERDSAIRHQESVALRFQEELEIRSRVKTLALLYNPGAETTGDQASALDEIKAKLESLIHASEVKQTLSAEARTSIRSVQQIKESIANRKAEIRALRVSQSELARNLKEARSRMTRARDIMKHAADVRAKVVQEVFDDELNQVWRDLFIRLAPSEPFVPRFGKTTKSNRGTTQLQVIHRASGRIGPPNTLLSAGNLNTAALTLFLSLNLTANSRLPWLFLDDPVQSMDDVHISQFAALLRAFTGGLSKQVVIAVHERALFDYLALELSPAGPEERLVTVELSRRPLGASTAKVETIEWQEERAWGA